MKKLSYLFILISVFFLYSCNPDLEKPTIGAGGLNLARIQTVGDSYFAGYMDNALYLQGQENSLGAILAKQLQLVGAGEFNQPLVPAGPGLGTPVIGNNAYYVMREITDCLGAKSLEPTPVEPIGDIEGVIGTTISGTYQNLAIPLIKTGQVTFKGLSYFQNFPNYSPYFKRFSPSDSASIIGLAMEQNPTFAAVWVGSGDYVFYAVQGGVNDASGINIYDMTPAETLRVALKKLIEAYQTQGTQIVMANYPALSSLPFFHTVPYDTLILTQSEADSLNALWNDPKVSFHEGRNPILVSDANGDIRHIKSDELPLLTALPEIKCNKLGSETELSQSLFLETQEIEWINDRVNSYNQILKELSEQYHFPVVDVNSFLKGLELSGKQIEGIPFSTKFVEGGFFSLDGIHFTPRGNAVIANEFIKTINSYYSANVPLVDITQYRGNIFP